MTRLVFAALAAALLSGCGGGPAEVKVKSLTAAERAEVERQDRALDDDEKSGSGTAVGGKKRKK